MARQKDSDPISTEDLVTPGGHDTSVPEQTGDVSSRPVAETPDTAHSAPAGRDAGHDGSVRGDLAAGRTSSTANGLPTGQTASGEQDEGHTALIEDSDSSRFRDRWHDVQAEFVDDPQRAVQDADRLVAELMQTLAATFADRKQALEGQWQQGRDAETEDLRLALRSYRSFFDQLLPH